MKRIMLIIICAILTCWGCSEDNAGLVQQPEDKITLSTELLSTNFEGGTKEVVVTSSGDWRLSGTATWVQPSVMEGKSGDAILFTIAPNDTDQNRQTEFKMFTGNAVARLTVICGEGYLLSLESGNKVSLASDSGEFAVKLATNIPQEELQYTYSDGGKEWIELVKTTDVFGDLLLTFAAMENPNYSDRQSRLTISGHDLSVFVDITQRQSDYLNVIAEQKYEFEDLEAASFEISVEGNIPYEITTPEWIAWEKLPQSRSLITERIEFNISKSDIPRSGEIVIADVAEQFVFRISVTQLAPEIEMISIPDKNFRLKLQENGWIRIVDPESPEVIPIDYETIKKDDWYPNILRVNNADIESIEGVENFPWVTQLNLGNNKLTRIDISGLELVRVVDANGNPDLAEIICGSNKCSISHGARFNIQLLTVSGAATEINLSGYYISGDQLKELDVTECPDLVTINGQGRKIETVYITAAQEGKISLQNSPDTKFVIR